MVQEQINFDKMFLMLLPVAFFFILILLDGLLLKYASILVIALAFYEIVVYHKRYIYGLTALRIISLPALTFVTFTVFIAIPAVHIAAINPHRGETFFLAVSSFFFIYPAGLFVGDLTRTVKYSSIQRLTGSSLFPRPTDEFYFKLLVLLFIVCSLGFVLYLSRVETVPLFYLLQDPGNAIQARILREEAFKLLDMTVFEAYFYSWMRALFYPIGVIGSLFIAYKYRVKKYWLLFTVFFGTGILFNALTLEKAPSAAIFLSVIAFFFVKEEKVSLRFILIAIVAVFSIPAIIIIMHYSERTNLAEMVWIGITNRIFVVPSEVLYQYFRTFPDIHDFLLGRSTNLTAWLHPKGLFEINHYIMGVWHGIVYTTGSANANYLGYYWADYGPEGLVLSTFLVGYIVHLLYWKLLDVSEYRKDINYIAIICYLVPLFTLNFFSANFSILFFTKGILLVIIYMFIYQYYLKKNQGNLELA